MIFIFVHLYSSLLLFICGRETESAKQLLLAAQLLEKSKEEECIKQAAVVATLMEGAFVLRESRSAEEDEISRLEAVLSLAKERNRNTLIKQTTLDIKISTENRTKEVRTIMTCIHPLTSHYYFLVICIFITSADLLR